MSEQWIYEGMSHTDTAHHVMVAETGEVVLMVPFDPEDDESFEVSMRRAIRASALPELEAACEAAEEVVLEVLSNTENRACDREKARLAWEKIQAAIAKASGGAA